MEPNACPHCRRVLTDEQVVRLYKRYASSRRVVKAGGKNGGRPVKTWIEESRPKRGERGIGSGVGASMVKRAKPSPLQDHAAVEADWAAIIRHRRGLEAADEIGSPISEVNSDQLANLRDLLQKTEARVGMGELTAAAISALTSPCNPSPLDESEGRRWWSEEWGKLEQLGMSDEGGAAEGLAELLNGVRVPNGFTRWTRARKIDWLVENLKIGDQ